MGTWKDILSPAMIQSLRQKAIDNGELGYEDCLVLIRSNETLRAYYLSKRARVSALEREASPAQQTISTLREEITSLTEALEKASKPLPVLPPPNAIPVQYATKPRQRERQCKKLYRKSDRDCPCPPGRCWYRDTVSQVQHGGTITPLERWIGYPVRDS